MIQLMIAITGLTALGLTQQNKREDWKKFAPIFGLIGQPFWIISTLQTQQWGIFCLCCCYTVLWMMGFYNSWISNDYKGWKEFRGKEKHA